MLLAVERVITVLFVVVIFVSLFSLFLFVCLFATTQAFDSSFYAFICKPAGPKSTNHIDDDRIYMLG